MMHGNVEVGNERVEVEWLVVGGLVLGRDDRALDDEDVEAAVESGPDVALDVLRRERGGSHDAAILDLLHALRDEFGLDRLLVDLLHLGGRLFVRERADGVELGVGVLVACLDTLEVEYGEATELAHGHGERWIHDTVHRRGEKRRVERVLLAAEVEAP